MSRSVNCFEDVNGEGHFFGDSLFCLRRTPVGVGSWGGDSGLMVEKTDPEKEGFGDFLGNLPGGQMRGIMTGWDAQFTCAFFGKVLEYNMVY